MVVGQLTIELLANMARLQTDMERAKRTVGDTVAKMNQVLGTIGVGISVAGFTSLIKGVIDAGDRMNDLRKITGLTIEQLGGLGKLAKLNGTDLDAVAKAVGIMSKNMYAGSAAFDVLGIATKDSSGQLRNAGQVLLEVSDRFSRMEDGATKSALANQIFGKSGRELIPLLNEGRSAIEGATEAYRLHSGMSLQTAQASDEFNDILTKLSGRVTAVKNSFVSELLPTLNNIGNAMLATGQSTNQFSFAASVVMPVLKGLAIAGFTVIDTFRGMGREIGARAAQLVAFANLDFSGAKFIGTALAEDNKKSRAEYDKFVDTIMNGDKAVNQFTDTQKEYLKIEQQIPGAVDKTSRATEKKNKEFNMQLYLLKQYDDEARRARDITQSVATEQEIYNQKLEELNRLKPYLTIETYDRALAKLSDTNKKVEVSTQRTTDEVSQLWMQAGRNIQSTLANSIFNFFDDGLKGMLKNVISTVGRIASEFAALRLAQSIGLSSMFSGGGVGGTGSVGGGIGSIFDIASLGNSAMSFFSNGSKALGSLLGRGAASFGLGSFGAGASGAASAGVFGPGGAAFLAGPGTAIGGTAGAGAAAAEFGALATAGAGMAAVAGPLAALAAGFMAGDFIAGSKEIAGIGGTEAALIGTALGGPVGAVVAGSILALFGRGPFKFRQQSLQGTVSETGFDGDITNVERAKGGLLRSNAHRSTKLELTSEMQDLFDTAVGAFYKSAHGFAESLGLDVNLVDGFTKELQIKSEKGKQLTGEAVSAMIAGIGDSLAQNLIPAIETLKKGEETAFQTLTRLGGEFNTLSSAAVNLGASVKLSNELIRAMTFESRSSLLAMAGGTENLNNLTGFFAQNFLTEAERLAPIQERLVTGLTDLGQASNLTNEQYKALVQSMDITDETRIKLLELGPAILTVNAALDATNKAASDAAKALADAAQAQIEAMQAQAEAQAKTNLGNLFSALQRSVEAERKKVTTVYNNDLLIVNKSIQNVTDSISKLKSLSSALGSTIDALRPLSRDEAKFQLLSAINTAKAGGGLPDAANITKALDVLKSNNITGVRSSFEMAREQAKTANLVADLSSLTDSQLSVEERSLLQLQDQKRTLDEGFKNEMERLDSIIEQAQAQIDAMNGLNTSVVNLTTAIANFNLASTQGGGGTIGSGAIASGNLDYSNKDIIDYFKTEHSARQIYIDAVSRGISSAQIVNSGAVTQAQADQYFKDNPKIPHFAAGGYHRGGLRIVGENGPELESTGPSNITSNSDMKKATGNDQVVALLTEIKKDISGMVHGQFTVKTKTA